MNDQDEQSQLNDSAAGNEQLSKPSIQIGGTSTSYGEAYDEELTNNGLPQQQTTIVGLHGREDGEQQVEVIAPEYQQEKNAKPTQYISESQATIEKDLRKKGPASLIILLAILLFLGAIGYVYYLLNS